MYATRKARHYSKVIYPKYYINKSVPNRLAGRNKRAGGKILKKTLNVQDRIDVQGGKFSGKSIIVQGENKHAGGN